MPTATLRARFTAEPQATNQILSSEQFDSGSWSRSAATPNANATGALDGTNGAEKLVDSTANSIHQINQTVNLAAGTFTFSIFAKAAEYDMLDINLAVGQNRDTVFDLTNGSIPTKDASVTASTVSYGNGWWRCIVTATVAAGSGPVYLVLYKRGTGITFTGTGSSGVYIWGAQLEAGPAATSYYPTAGAAATRPLGYVDGWQSYTLNTGAQLACPAPAVKLRRFTAAESANAYAFGGGADARLWLSAPVQAYGMALDIVDTANLLGFIEAAFWYAGPVWEAQLNVDYGASSQPIDMSVSDRNDAGDLITDLGPRARQLNLPMSKLAPADQNALWDLLTSSGTGHAMFISVFPGHTDLALERRMQLLGKLVETPAMSLPYFNIGSATLQVASV